MVKSWTLEGMEGVSLVLVEGMLCGIWRKKWSLQEIFFLEELSVSLKLFFLSEREEPCFGGGARKFRGHALSHHYHNMERQKFKFNGEWVALLL
jgi:hypothetical protein